MNGSTQLVSSPLVVTASVHPSCNSANPTSSESYRGWTHPSYWAEAPSILLSWLAVQSPSWKIWVNVKDYPIYEMENKNVWNHQPLSIFITKHHVRRWRCQLQACDMNKVSMLSLMEDQYSLDSSSQRGTALWSCVSRSRAGTAGSAQRGFRTSRDRWEIRPKELGDNIGDQ